jgi:hypothetical protein
MRTIAVCCVLFCSVLYPEVRGRKSWSSGRVGEKWDTVLCVGQVWYWCRCLSALYLRVSARTRLMYAHQLAA